MKHNVQYATRVLGRWALILAMLALLLFAAAGTTRIASIRAYLVAYAAFLLVAMSAVDPRLARERTSPGPDVVAPHLRVLSAALFLLTLSMAAFVAGRVHTLSVPMQLRWIAVVVFILSSTLQTWSMVKNPFFSPAVRIQSENGHHLIDSGPYSIVRHPGYLAMCISIPASALAIGSWLALVPAGIFVAIIIRRIGIEDEFLRKHLPGYQQYASRVPGAVIPRLRRRFSPVCMSECHDE